jgi:hypothetical protein
VQNLCAVIYDADSNQRDKINTDPCGTGLISKTPAIGPVPAHRGGFHQSGRGSSRALSSPEAPSEARIYLKEELARCKVSVANPQELKTSKFVTIFASLICNTDREIPPPKKKTTRAYFYQPYTQRGGGYKMGLQIVTE